MTAVVEWLGTRILFDGADGDTVGPRVPELGAMVDDVRWSLDMWGGYTPDVDLAMAEEFVRRFGGELVKHVPVAHVAGRVY